jgi:hypothetical protein
VRRAGASWAPLLAALGLAACTAVRMGGEGLGGRDPLLPAELAGVLARSRSCVACHPGRSDPHPLATDPDAPGRFADRIACTDCHGGDGAVPVPAGAAPGSPAYVAARREAHGKTAAGAYVDDSALFTTSANPVRSAAALLEEPWESVRFRNPGDLRTAAVSCGSAGCHGPDRGDLVRRVRKSMMAHGAMLWGAALYNNGSYPEKRPRFGESYAPSGLPERIVTEPPPSREDMALHGVLPALEPLPRFEIGEPSNVLRVFERGQRRPLAIGLPTPGKAGFGLEDEPGRPDNRLSARGFGTGNRTDPVFLNLQRTRLLDPTLNMLGTNDHAGDYRSSGCTACHVIYANDRDPAHAGPYARYGSGGRSFARDPTIPKDEPGHPIEHVFTRRIPSSQCVVCHMHPGTAVEQSYLGYTWWDLETDGGTALPGGRSLWPREEVHPSAEERRLALVANPEGSTPKGSWRDPAFLAASGSREMNAAYQKMQVADFHGHGFIFRAVYKRDRHGALLDGAGAEVAEKDPERWKKAVHLRDIHLERGMHCVDCHFDIDAHGDGRLYGELRAATAVKCVDCHGTIDAAATLVTSGNAGGQDLNLSQTPFGKRFRWRGPPRARGSRLVQQSAVDAQTTWVVPQIRDTIDPVWNPDYRAGSKYERSRYAKTVRKDGGWGSALAGAGRALAHEGRDMECYTCHSSWVPSCFGCHLPMRANEKREALHNEGGFQRNWTSYSFQTIRDDVFMLGRDGIVNPAGPVRLGKDGRPQGDGKIVPVRSACAVMVGSQNQNREWVYSQQQTVSAEGFSGTSFSPNFPHTVREAETKRCTDCHVARAGDNNAVMAQLLMLGTNAASFIGRYCWVGEGAAGFDAVVVTEREEPQAVIGSRLHELAFPERFAAHVARGRTLGEAEHHAANSVAGLALPFGGDEVRSVQQVSEWLLTANGPGGLRVYDIAEIDQKGFSEKIVSAPVSPLGQRLAVPTKDATSVRLASTQAIDPLRARRPENAEEPIHPLYGYIYVTDREEGLILVGAGTLVNGDPEDNFLERAVTFDGGGALKGAVGCAIAGEHVYVACDRGIVVVSVADPLHPRVVGEIGGPAVVRPRAIAVQFRYGFVCDAEGVKVLDLTDPEKPKRVAAVRLAAANAVYLSRTYAYVAAGREGLVVLDVERPEKPVRVDFPAIPGLDDARDVKVAMTNASAYAYVADGRNGLRVLQLTSPDDPLGAGGFSPRPRPRLVATYPTRGPALAVSEGIARDRAVDESGHETGVFGRLGSRPFNLEEMQRLYLRNGALFTVTDAPDAPPAAEGGR